MLEFTFENIEGFLIAFLPALLNLAIVFYIYWKFPENRLTNIFALLTLALACWQINDSLTRISTSAEITNTWDTIFCAAWIFVGPLCLHFSLLYTSFLKPERSRSMMLFLYGPAIVFMLLYQAQVYPHIYVYHPLWGYVNYHDKHIIDIIQIYWISILVVSASVIIFSHAYKIRNDQMFKKQTIIIATGIAIPTIAGLIGQVIVPLLLAKPAVPVASTFMSFFSLATVISLNKFRLFNAADMVSDVRMIEDMPVILVSVSDKKRITYINKYASKILDINKSDIGLLSFDKLLKFEIPEEEDRLTNAFLKTLDGELISDYEARFVTSDGTIDVLISIKPIINNKQIQGVLFAGRDITALKKSNELIATKELLLADAQKISHIGSWEWNLNENSIVWSDELFRIFGYEPGMMDLNFQKILSHFHHNEILEVENTIKKAIISKETFSFNGMIKHKDNRIVNIHVIGKVMTGYKNNTIKMSGTVQDITDQISKEMILTSQNEELQKINLELDKFVYSVSHDLRAPLLSMQGIVEITKDETLEELTKSHMEMLSSSIARLDKFIVDILDYSRNTRGELKINPVDFNELIKTLTEDLKYMNKDSKVVEIRHSINSEGTFNTDYSRMSVILNNLVSNAIRYHNPASKNPFVNITINANNQKAQIEIEDNGLGIHEENHDKIFEMFYRVSENSTGSGLGLYIVKEAINKLHGKIRLKSKQGEGSKFIIEVPNLINQ